MENKGFKYKQSYTVIFALNYFAQGLVFTIFTAVIPIYLLTTYGSIDQAALAFMLSIMLIPATIKIFYGLLSDKVTFKKLGRRKPWIISSACFGGIVWIIISFIQTQTINEAISLFTIAGLLIMFGLFISDTALDGFLLDICPKEQLGRNQGVCWGLRAVGIIIGGPIILLFLIFIPIQFIFIMVGIILIVFSFLTLKIEHIDISKEFAIGKNLKLIFKSGENWKMFTFSFFIQTVGGVVYAFLSLYILIQLGLVNPVGATLDTLEDVSLYESQAIITLFISLGIIVGAILGGIISDKTTRKKSLIMSLSLNTVSLVILLLPVPAVLLIIFATLVGVASGWIFSAYSAITAEYSQQYPEMDSTYFAICVSFVNVGTLLGLVITGILFNSVTTFSNDIIIIYGIIFIFMAILQLLSLIPFSSMKKEIFEYKLKKE